ncbi:MAG TPA: FG-GAP-like repeat-containing protein, partial [Verrucomicrobiae bacterium]
WGHGSAGLPNIDSGSAAWGDYNNDGRLDLLLVSQAGLYHWGSENFCGIARNDSGVFTNTSALFPALGQAAAAWSDYDNDGFLDLVVAGVTDSSSTNLLFHNNGDGAFTPVDAGLPPVFNCSVAWGDYDNDGQLDLLIAGDTGAGCITRIYRNNNGVFTDIRAGLTGVASGSVAWGDVNGDGWPDVLIAGTTNGTATGAVCKVYRNNHDGSFTEVDAGLPGVFQGAASWGDYDNDGRLDVLLTGIGETFGPARIYRNDGAKFSDVAAGLPTSSLGLAAWGDYDGDGMLDVALIASGSGFYFLGANVYRNCLNVPMPPPNAPGAPDGLTSSVLHNSVTLSWIRASDPNTPSPGLTYNVRVGTTPGGGQIVSSASDPLTGQRRVPQMGNAQQCLHHWLSNLAIGTYYWSVQAVNQSFVGSPWSTEKTFSISSGPPVTVTLAATNVLCCSALLNGMAKPGVLPTLAWFDWGTDSTSLSNGTPPISLTTGVLPQAVQQTIELSPRTTYFFRFAASNSAALVRGTILSFTTEGPAPEVVTFGASNVSYTTALVMGAWGASSPAAELFIEWGETAAYGRAVAAAVLHPRPAVALDGVDDLVAVGWGHFPLVTNTFSMELRARPVAARAPDPWGVGGQRYAIFPDQGGLTYGNLVHAGAGLSVGTNGVTVFESSDFYIPAVATFDFYSTNWMHFAVVYEGHEPHLYIDGVHVCAGSVSERIVHPSADLGGNTNLGYGQFQGEIQEFRIWGTSLDAGTIQAWMNRPLTAAHPAYAQLVGYWPLDEGAGTVAIDHGPFRYDGQLLNGVSWGSGWLSEDRLFAVVLTNLIPGTTYHFRARATNPGGTVFGVDQAFTTLPLPRVLSVTPQSGGKYLLRFDGIPSQAYAVEVSTNLVTWTARTNLIAGLDGNFGFEDDATGNIPALFYRLKVP